MKHLKFKKEDTDRWYIVLKNWLGPKSALEMVMGADTLLDKLSDGGDEVTVTVKKNEGPGDYVCVKDKQAGDDYGRWYDVFRNGEKVHRMWLCPVTRFVFMGFYPDEIIFENITEKVL